MGCHFLLQGIFLTQGLYPCFLHFLHWRWIIYCLRHQGSLVIWVPRLTLLDQGTNRTYDTLSELNLCICRGLNVWEINPTWSRQYEYLPCSFQSVDTSRLLNAECGVGPSPSPSYPLQVHPSLETALGNRTGLPPGIWPISCLLITKCCGKRF